MKTSTKLFIAAIATLFVLLVIYDFGLKAAYSKGTNTHAGKTKNIYTHKNFDLVRINSAGVVKVMIVPGDYKVEVSPESFIDATISQTGNLLTVDINFLEDVNYYSNRRAVYIYMPHLKELTTDSRYTIKGKSHMNKRVEGLREAGVVVQGFNHTFSIDSLTVIQDNASTVNFAGNKIGYLKTVLGKSTGSKSAMNIYEGNQIQAAQFDVRGSSYLNIENVAIPSLQFNASDSAQVALTGASALALIKK